MIGGGVVTALAGRGGRGGRGVSPGAATGVSLGAVLFAAFPISLIVMAIWPGSFALFAPLLCSADVPDAFVVVDSYQVRPGETAFNFTMYCVGPTGRFDEIGFFRPMAFLYTAVVVVLTVVIGVLVWRMRRRSNTTWPPGTPGGQDAGPIA